MKPITILDQHCGSSQPAMLTQRLGDKGGIRGEGCSCAKPGAAEGELEVAMHGVGLFRSCLCRGFVASPLGPVSLEPRAVGGVRAAAC